MSSFSLPHCTLNSFWLCQGSSSSKLIILLAVLMCAHCSLLQLSVCIALGFCLRLYLSRGFISTKQGGIA